MSVQDDFATVREGIDPGHPTVFFDAVDRIEEQVETLEAACEDTAMAASMFKEQRDRLQEQVETLERVNRELGDAHEERTALALELKEQYEGERRAHVAQARYEQGRYARLKAEHDEAVRLQVEARAQAIELKEQLEAYERAVEAIRLRTFKAFEHGTEARDTYADGYAAGLSQALNIVRIDIEAFDVLRESNPAKRPSE